MCVIFKSNFFCISFFYYRSTRQTPVSDFGSSFPQFDTREAEEGLAVREVITLQTIHSWSFFKKKIKKINLTKHQHSETHNNSPLFLSSKGTGQEAVATERPLVSEEAHTSSSNAQTGWSCHNMETCSSCIAFFVSLSVSAAKSIVNNNLLFTIDFTID